VSGRAVEDTEIRRAAKSKRACDLQIASGGAQRFLLRAPQQGSKSEVVVASARKGERMTPPGLEF
jgi:hypothetical protein